VSSYVGADVGNYQITDQSSTSATIDKAALTISANSVSKTYDGRSYIGGNGVSFSGFVTGDSASVLSGTLSYVGDSQGAIHAGSYSIVPIGLSSTNYAISYSPGSLLVDQAVLTLASVAAVKYFDETTASVALPQVLGLVPGDRVINLHQVYESASVGLGKTLRVQWGYVIADGNGGANYRVTLRDSLGDIVSQPAGAGVDAVNPWTAILQTAVPSRFPGSLDGKPFGFDLPMPTGRSRRGSLLDADDEEQTADGPKPSGDNQNPS